MAEILYWAVVSVIGTGLTWYFTGYDGFIFMVVVSLLGGVLLYIENKLHPHL